MPYKHLISFAADTTQLKAFADALEEIGYKPDPEPFFGSLFPPATTLLVHFPRNYIFTYHHGRYMFAEEQTLFPQNFLHFTGDQLAEAIAAAAEIMVSDEE